MSSSEDRTRVAIDAAFDPRAAQCGLATLSEVGEEELATVIDRCWAADAVTDRLDAAAALVDIA